MCAVGRKSYLGSRHTPADNRMTFSKCNALLYEIEQILVFLKIIPVKPGYFIIVAVRIIIAVLGIRKFIPGQKHCRASGTKKYCKSILLHSSSKLTNLLILRRSFLSAIPGIVVVGSVRILPAVRFVMFVIVAVKIV